MDQDAELQVEARPLNSVVFEVPENLPLNLIGRRPDLIAQKARLEAAAKEINAAKTHFYPSFNLRAFAGLESVFWSKLFSADSYFGALQPALNLPIFNAGMIKANLMGKVAEFNEAVASYDALILKAAQEIADILSTIDRFEKEAGIRELSLGSGRNASPFVGQAFPKRPGRPDGGFALSK